MKFKYFFRINNPLMSPTVRYVVASTKFEAMEKMKLKCESLFKKQDGAALKIRLQKKEPA